MKDAAKPARKARSEIRRRFRKTTRQMVERLTEIKNEEEKIRQGGGAKAIEAQHKKGRLTARERIAKLIDPGHGIFRAGALRRLRNVRGMGRRARRGNGHRPRATLPAAA